MLKRTFFILLVSSIVLAKTQKAHVHGAAEISIVFEGLQGEVEFHSPAESTQGFEYKARTAGDLKKQEQTLETLRTKISEMIVFSPTLKCQFTQPHAEFQIDQDSPHGETHATFKVSCLTSPRGSTLVFNLNSFFPKIKKAKVQLIIDDFQKQADLDQNQQKVELK